MIQDREIRKQKMRQWYKKNRDRQLAYKRAKYQREKESIKAKARQYTREHKSLVRDQKLRKQYGITTAEYERILADQDGRCAGCGITQETHGKRLFVDHCHRTGKVRGLLCMKCNFVLGNIGDREEILFQLATYLRRHNVDDSKS